MLSKHQQSQSRESVEEEDEKDSEGEGIMQGISLTDEETLALKLLS